MKYIPFAEFRLERDWRGVREELPGSGEDGDIVTEQIGLVKELKAEIQSPG